MIHQVVDERLHIENIVVGFLNYFKSVKISSLFCKKIHLARGKEDSYLG